MEKISLDCEFVGVGPSGRRNALARCTILNFNGDCIYDQFIKPLEYVTDYRTHVSGIRPKNLINAQHFSIAQKEIAEIIKNKIIIGHSLHHDLKVLNLSHPREQIRDIAHFHVFCPFRPRSLKNLTKEFLKYDIQKTEHSSMEDSLAALNLYKEKMQEWELSIKHRRKNTDSFSRNNLKKKQTKNNQSLKSILHDSQIVPSSNVHNIKQDISSHNIKSVSHDIPIFQKPYQQSTCKKSRHSVPSRKKLKKNIPVSSSIITNSKNRTKYLNFSRNENKSKGVVIDWLADFE